MDSIRTHLHVTRADHLPWDQIGSAWLVNSHLILSSLCPNSTNTNLSSDVWNQLLSDWFHIDEQKNRRISLSALCKTCTWTEYCLVCGPSPTEQLKWHTRRRGGCSTNVPVSWLCGWHLFTWLFHTVWKVSSNHSGATHSRWIVSSVGVGGS